MISKLLDFSGLCVGLLRRNYTNSRPLSNCRTKLTSKLFIEKFVLQLAILSHFLTFVALWFLFYICWLMLLKYIIWITPVQHEFSDGGFLYLLNPVEKFFWSNLFRSGTNSITRLTNSIFFSQVPTHKLCNLKLMCGSNQNKRFRKSYEASRLELHRWNCYLTRTEPWQIIDFVMVQL